MSDPTPQDQERAILFVMAHFGCSRHYAERDLDPFKPLRELHAAALAEQRKAHVEKIHSHARTVESKCCRFALEAVADPIRRGDA